LVASNSTESEEGTKPAGDLYLVGFQDKEAKQERDRLVTALLRIFNGNCSKRRSPVFLAARAALVEGCKAAHLNALVVEKGHRLIGQKARAKAKQDFKDAVAGLALERAPKTRKKVSDYSLNFAVTSMLSTENVGLWSWGQKRLLLLLLATGR
jgi:hypothetical protein